MLTDAEYLLAGSRQHANNIVNYNVIFIKNNHNLEYVILA